MEVTPNNPCIFCEIVDGRAPAEILMEWPETIAIKPLGPVVEGHTLIIPKRHVQDFTESPTEAMSAMLRASQFAETMGECNLITSKGINATQSVFHLHIHLVPRRENDGLALPWFSGKRRKTPIQGSGYTPSQLLGG